MEIVLTNADILITFTTLEELEKYTNEQRT